MHYETKYDPTDAIGAHNQAITDIKEYMGAERFEQATRDLKANWPNDPPTLDTFKIVVSFAGVQGFPVKAWYNYCFGL